MTIFLRVSCLLASGFSRFQTLSASTNDFIEIFLKTKSRKPIEIDKNPWVLSPGGHENIRQKLGINEFFESNHQH